MVRDSDVLVREIILENFMSHKYSKIPLKSGLNIISGPNGAGKSSILLGLAVAVGQTYTERSRKLGDLIKRGEKLGRVSLVFNNAARDGKRPIAAIDADSVVLSRYLSRDGNYWHEINGRSVIKAEVTRLLERLALNPDNLLIIMHQNMIDVFGAIDPKEKLKMVEEAVGLKEYRERIIDAMQKLSHAMSEEESIANLLARARETLSYWEDEFKRFERRRELDGKKKDLELEYAWAKFGKQDESVNSIKAGLHELEAELKEIKEDLKKATAQEKSQEAEISELDFEIDSSYQRLIEQERAQAESETQAKLAEDLKVSLEKLRMPEMKTLIQRLDADVARAKTSLKEAGPRAKTHEARLVETKKKIEKTREGYINSKVKIAVLNFRTDLVEGDIKKGQAELRRAKRELDEVEAEALKLGKKVVTNRKPQDVMDELRLVNVQLGTLADVSPDVERMYASYKSTIKELEEKARVAEANRRRALEDLDLRKQKWQDEVNKLLREVKLEYVRMLEKVHATGDVKLTDPQDIEEAGLELSVGFRGAEPQVLNAYTQSGGERTTSLMCFLLSLQRRIKSPLRAIDEFEAHLDPRNRETIMQSIIDSLKGEKTQYVLITPGRLVHIEQVPSVVTVQNVAGTSQAKVAS